MTAGVHGLSPGAPSRKSSMIQAGNRKSCCATSIAGWSQGRETSVTGGVPPSSAMLDRVARAMSKTSSAGVMNTHVAVGIFRNWGGTVPSPPAMVCGWLCLTPQWSMVPTLGHVFGSNELFVRIPVDFREVYVKSTGSWKTW